MPTTGTATIALRTDPAAARPIVPRPLWERHDLFQEPAYAPGLELLEDDSDDEDGEPIITA
ncbi:hypothetical protein ACGFNY_44180 [Streptomyces chartreusis]|uniref:hypothetical protein n=1 Tax=Streptomyces chartreusis TaxID=1969 RepID=UPI0037155C85